MYVLIKVRNPFLKKIILKYFLKKSLQFSKKIILSLNNSPDHPHTKIAR